MVRSPVARPTIAVWPLVGLAIVAVTLAQTMGAAPVPPVAVGAVALALFLFALPFVLAAVLQV